MLTSHYKKKKTKPSCASDIRKKIQNRHIHSFMYAAWNLGKNRNQTKTYVYNHQNHMNENNRLWTGETAVFQKLSEGIFKRDYQTFMKMNISLLPLIHIKHKMEGKAKAAPTGMLKIRNTDFWKSCRPSTKDKNWCHTKSVLKQTEVSRYFHSTIFDQKKKTNK